MAHDKGTHKLRSACDNCHHTKVKCPKGQPCERCLRDGFKCVYSKSNRIGRPKDARNRKTLDRLQRFNAMHPASDHGDIFALAATTDNNMKDNDALIAVDGFMSTQDSAVGSDHSDSGFFDQPFETISNGISATNLSMGDKMPEYAALRRSHNDDDYLQQLEEIGCLFDSTESDMPPAASETNPLTKVKEVDASSDEALHDYLLTSHANVTPYQHRSSLTTPPLVENPCSARSQTSLLLTKPSPRIASTCKCFDSQANLVVRLRRLSGSAVRLEPDEAISAISETLAVWQNLLRCRICCSSTHADHHINGILETLVLAVLGGRHTLQIVRLQVQRLWEHSERPRRANSYLDGDEQYEACLNDNQHEEGLECDVGSMCLGSYHPTPAEAHLFAAIILLCRTRRLGSALNQLQAESQRLQSQLRASLSNAITPGQSDQERELETPREDVESLRQTRQVQNSLLRMEVDVKELVEKLGECFRIAMLAQNTRCCS
ncbi:MAG: hypothetical protein Q9214_001695 [Letrouitia sp. 1 TL-2023]